MTWKAYNYMYTLLLHKPSLADVHFEHVDMVSYSGAIYIALVEGRGQAKGEVGLATIDLKNPVLFLSQVSMSNNYRVDSINYLCHTSAKYG